MIMVTVFADEGGLCLPDCLSVSPSLSFSLSYWEAEP